MLKNTDEIIHAFTRKELTQEQIRQIKSLRQGYLQNTLRVTSELPDSAARTDAIRLLVESHTMALFAVSHYSKGKRNVQEEKTDTPKLPVVEPVQSGELRSDERSGDPDAS